MVLNAVTALEGLLPLLPPAAVHAQLLLPRPALPPPPPPAGAAADAGGARGAAGPPGGAAERGPVQAPGGAAPASGPAEAPAAGGAQLDAPAALLGPLLAPGAHARVPPQLRSRVAGLLLQARAP